MDEIETQRLHLRVCTPDQLDRLQRIYTEPDIRRCFQLDAISSATALRPIVAGLAAHWNLHHYGIWSICHRQQGCLIGQCGLIALQPPLEAELTYLLARRYRGQGFATEAARASVRYAFEQRGLRHVVALVQPDNVASQRVLESIGMQQQRLALYAEHDQLCYMAVPATFQAGDAPYCIRPAGVAYKEMHLHEAA